MFESQSFLHLTIGRQHAATYTEVRAVKQKNLQRGTVDIFSAVNKSEYKEQHLKQSEEFAIKKKLGSGLKNNIFFSVEDGAQKCWNSFVL